MFLVTFMHDLWKTGRSVKTINPPSFLVHFWYPRGSKIQHISLKRGVENGLKIKCDFEIVFSWMLRVVFDLSLGSQDRPKKASKNDGKMEGLKKAIESK